ncbi:MAG: hypothetical protein ACK4GO_18010 [Gemmobacter sp.]
MRAFLPLLCLALTLPAAARSGQDLPVPTAPDFLAPAFRDQLPGDWAIEAEGLPPDPKAPQRLELSFPQNDWPNTYVTMTLTSHAPDLARLAPVFDNAEQAQGMGAAAETIAGHDCRTMARPFLITCRLGTGMVQISATTIGTEPPFDIDTLRSRFAESPFELYARLLAAQVPG